MRLSKAYFLVCFWGGGGGGGGRVVALFIELRAKCVGLARPWY